jgi:hypothetical protein
MTKKLFLAAGSLMLLLGTVGLQGCFEDEPYGYGRGYNSGGYYSQPYYSGGGYRDYDEHPNWWANHEAAEERHEAHERQEEREERREAREHHHDHDD